MAIKPLYKIEIFPALILLNLMMPVMGGQEFILSLQEETNNERFKEIPIIVLSAANKPICGDIAAYMKKPPQLEQLMVLIDKFSS